MTSALELSVLSGRFAVARLAADAALPSWARSIDFVSVTRTDEELSIVCPESSVPPGIESEAGFRRLKVLGPLDFSLTGVLSSLASPLAEAKVSIFAISTFDTDYVLVRESDLERALAALEQAGHRFVE